MGSEPDLDAVENIKIAFPHRKLSPDFSVILLIASLLCRTGLSQLAFTLLKFVKCVLNNVTEIISEFHGVESEQ
jgi:hypothetical protein